jgi:hypothetical protein
MDDTSPAAEEIQARIHRRMSGPERLMLAFEMSESARELALARLRRAHPDWTDHELRRELLRYAFLAVDGAPAELPVPLR